MLLAVVALVSVTTWTAVPPGRSDAVAVTTRVMRTVEGSCTWVALPALSVTVIVPLPTVVMLPVTGLNAAAGGQVAVAAALAADVDEEAPQAASSAPKSGSASSARPVRGRGRIVIRGSSCLCPSQRRARY